VRSERAEDGLEPLYEHGRRARRLRRSCRRPRNADHRMDDRRRPVADARELHIRPSQDAEWLADRDTNGGQYACREKIKKGAGRIAGATQKAMRVAYGAVTTTSSMN